jgi:hypothetical protein
MAELQEKTEGIQDKLGSGAGGTALKAAAAAAATTAATIAVKKALSHDGEHRGNGSNGRSASSGSGRSGASGILASAAATSWDAASDVLLPLADDAAEAAGKYVATHGPEIVRERIVPKFIEAFNDAK